MDNKDFYEKWGDEIETKIFSIFDDERDYTKDKDELIEKYSEYFVDIIKNSFYTVNLIGFGKYETNIAFENLINYLGIAEEFVTENSSMNEILSIKNLRSKGIVEDLYSNRFEIKNNKIVTDY